jgi:hypothetical protein
MSFMGTPACMHSLQGEAVVELVDVDDYLLEQGIQGANFSFLSTAPDRITLLIAQPNAVIDATATSLHSSDTETMVSKMLSFLELAGTTNVDVAVCPEYSCPWEALLAFVECGNFPRQNALWAICCESITPEHLNAAKERAAQAGLFVLQQNVVQNAGNFLNCLCYLFLGTTVAGDLVKVLLIQPKTYPMGGVDYERDSLILGRTIYRFGREHSNRLVVLVCSDVMGDDFKRDIVQQLALDTLVIHLQLNPDSAAPGFREYRDSCCTMIPRTTEILCLNWAKGSKIRSGDKDLVSIDEPKSIYYRVEKEIRAKDEDIVQNHKKGVFLSYWQEQRTAAYLFSPYEQVFHISTSKAVMTKAAGAVGIRSGLKALRRYEWVNSTWSEAEQDSDDSYAAYLHQIAEFQSHLGPFTDKLVDMERLVQFSTGFGLGDNWYDWRTLPSFRLAHDDTSGRLRLCWSEVGAGPRHRLESFNRLRSLLYVVDEPSRLPLRLVGLKGTPIKLHYTDSPAWQRITNLKSDAGYGTAVYMGSCPSTRYLESAKRMLQSALYDFNIDKQKLSILYRDHTGALKDHMDSFTPAVNDDPGDDPKNIASSST